jgi:hypothetical protein
MGFLWYPGGGVEAGIDGHLEIRNEDSEVTNCIISVHSKATDGALEGETESELTFTLKRYEQTASTARQF